MCIAVYNSILYASQIDCGWISLLSMKMTCDVGVYMCTTVHYDYRVRMILIIRQLNLNDFWFCQKSRRLIWL